MCVTATVAFVRDADAATAASGAVGEATLARFADLIVRFAANV